jgi:type I restriction enzyme S subunit
MSSDLENKSTLEDFGLTSLPIEWGAPVIGDLLAEDRGISVGVMYPGDHCDQGIPLVKAGDLKSNWINPNPPFRITPDKHYEYRRTELEGGELLISLVGNAGQTAVVPSEMKGWNVARAVAVVRLSNGANPHFIKYALQSPALGQLMKSWCNTTVQETLNLKEIRRLPIPFPATSEQKAIAHILGTIDDKIELNRKTNETLEAMAKALFKSWFVDFDPVRAKAEGRATGLPAEISDLFPDSFEDSELGEIPNGWRVFELGDCSLHIESGTRPKGGIDKNLAFGIPSIGAESISPIGQFDFSKTKWVNAAFAQSAGRGWIQNYDVALYKDGGKPGEFRPRTALYGDGFPFDKAMVNEHVFLLRSSQLGQPYLYYLFNFDLVLAQIIHKGSSKGAQPGLNQDEVRTSSFVKPDKRVLDVFNLTIEPSIRKQLLLGKNCQVLSQLRDALLPKLISGEIRIPDAEKMLEKVGV